MMPEPSPRAATASATTATLLAGVALACAAVLAVQDTASSRMLVWPWQLLYWLGPLAAGGALLFSLPTPFRLGHWWRGALLAGAVGLIASTLASPFREQILPWVAWPLTTLTLTAAGARLLADPAQGPNRERWLLVSLGSAGSVLVATSLVMWLADLAPDFGAVLRSRNPHPLGHANYTAGTALLFLPLFAGLAWHARGVRRAGWLGAGTLCLAMLLSGGSRGALIGLAAMTAVVCLLAWRARWLPRPLLLVAALAMVTLGALQPGVRRGLLPPPPEAPVNMSNAQRATWIKGGLAAVAERPLAGWGAGATPWFFPRHRGDLDYGPYTVLQLHNTPLQLWAEGGALTLLSALALTSLVGLAMWRERSQIPSASPPHRPSAFWPAVIAFTGYGVFSITDYQLDLPIVAVTLGLLLAVIAARATRPNGGDEPPHPLLRPAMIATGVLIAGIAWVAVDQSRLRAALDHGDWQTALQIAPNDASLRLYAADRLLHTTQGIPADADARREQALALLDANAAGNQIPELTHSLSGWARLPDDPAGAARDFDAAIAVAPNHHSALLGSALAAISLGQREHAVQALTRASLARPRFLASGWWRMPALAELRPEVEARLNAALTRLATDPAARPSIRREAEYLQALINWCAGNHEAGDELAAKATNAGRRVFWTRLLGPTTQVETTALPPGLQSVLALAADRSRHDWEIIIRGTLKADFPLTQERALIGAQPLLDSVRGALTPAMNQPWPHYERRGTRAGFQVNHRHPLLQGINDGGAHRENLWADLLLAPLWPDEFWLPDSLLKELAQGGLPSR